MRLSHRDVDLLQETILDLHDLRDSATFLQAAPLLFRNIVPSDWSVIMNAEVDLSGKRVLMMECWETSKVMTPELEVRMERVAFDHPFSHYLFERRA